MCGKREKIESKIPKVLEKIDFRPLIYYSIKSFNDFFETEGIYLVVSKDNVKNFEKLLSNYKKYFKKLKEIIIGGEERFDSVKNAFDYLIKNGSSEFVAIHDGARPFIKKELINSLYLGAKEYGASAPGIKVIDTIKSVSNDKFIENHLKRDKLIAIQTPQMFKFEDIVTAYNLYIHKEFWTDDTEIFSKLNKRVKIIDGDKDLIKITYKEDMILAKNIYKRIKHLWK